MKANIYTVVIIMLIGNGYTRSADQQDKAPPENTKLAQAGPYCGVYCFYGAMQLFGKDLPFRELLDPRYISSARGSSLSDLRRVADDNGVYSFAADNLTVRDLRRCPYPVILHVKAEAEDTQYGHYFLYLGKQGNLALVFDPPGPVRAIPFEELIPLWDGSGLILSTEPKNVLGAFIPTHGFFLIAAMIVGLLVLGIRWIGKRWYPRETQVKSRQFMLLTAAQVCCFILMSCICGLIYHASESEALLTAPRAVETIQRVHRADFVPKINSTERVRRLLDNEVVFVDARYTRDFKLGHIDKAISVPINANDTERQERMKDIPMDKPLVIYCQSSGCKYAEIVAVDLLQDGFSDVSVFRGGWRAFNGER